MGGPRWQSSEQPIATKKSVRHSVCTIAFVPECLLVLFTLMKVFGCLPVQILKESFLVKIIYCAEYFHETEK